MTQRQTPISYWLRIITVLLLVSLLIPSASAFAQSLFPKKTSALASNLTPLKDASFQNAMISSENLTTANLVQDGSFEAYDYLAQDDPYWNEYDSYYASPLCTVFRDCDYYAEAHPNLGYSWAWFGLTREPVRSASLSQVITFPSCGYGTLQFYLWIGYAEAGSGTDDVFYAKIDGYTVFTANATQKNTYPSYKLIQVPIYLADGNPHTLEFSHVNTTQAVIFNLDDVSLTWNYCPKISGSAGVAGATLSYGSSQTVLVGEYAWYSLTVPFGWSGTVTPSKPGYTFSPPSRTYVNVSTDLDFEDYTATPLFAIISGWAGVAGATLSYGNNQTVLSDAGGWYSLTVPTGWNGTVTPSKTCYTFDPPSRSYALSPVYADLAGQHYTATPVTNFSTFCDVPDTHWAADFINRLSAAGITGGCGTNPAIYCPGATVTRDQMAVFLLKGKYGSSYVPPTATGVFQDVPINFWAGSWIEQLATEGITAGCGSGKYCPTTAVTRDQMAVFLLKAKYGSDYVPPAPTGMFSDVPTNYWAAGWIEQLAVEGITAGCGGGKYCPTTPVTRDQMAVFLVKNFNLP